MAPTYFRAAAGIWTCAGRRHVSASVPALKPGAARYGSSKRCPPARLSNSKIAFVAANLAAANAVLIWWWTAGRHAPPDVSEAPPFEDLILEGGLSKDDVTRILSKESYSFPVRDVDGVKRHDGARLVSNNPCEDRFIHGQMPSPSSDGKDWLAWGVFDGHSGWQTAHVLTKQLLPQVRLRLCESTQFPENGTPPLEGVQGAIAKAFVDLDQLIFRTALDAASSGASLSQKIWEMAPAFSGSCALLSLYDPGTRSLHVACTGDSRAVMGRRTADGKWEAVDLSVDQDGSNEDEVARISKEHPGEEGIAKDGRILGLMVSRAFGDSKWKLPLDVQQDLEQRFNGPAPLTPRYDVRTPPYLTAEPVVTTTTIDASQPSFVIMASDGLWYCLDSQQAVDLVGKWLDTRAPGNTGREPEPQYAPFDFGHHNKGVSWYFVEERTTVVDANAAVHLMRNALGGNHHELLAGRLTFLAPASRAVRDDITVQVIFFGGDFDAKLQ